LLSFDLNGCVFFVPCWLLRLPRVCDGAEPHVTAPDFKSNPHEWHAVLAWISRLMRYIITITINNYLLRTRTAANSAPAMPPRWQRRKMTEPQWCLDDAETPRRAEQRYGVTKAGH
jgi:hypothetical protein